MSGEFHLLTWLRRNPKPRKLRLTSEDDEKIVDLGTARIKWSEVEQTVLNAGASLVECLDAKGEILRSYRLADDDGSDPEDKPIRDTDKLVARTQTTNAAMLDAYGKRMCEAFGQGAAAANVSQENLVAIVETLSNHLSLAITNLHTLSVNMANMVQQQGGDGESNKSDAIMGLVTAMIGKQLQAPASNGAKKAHE